MRRRGKIWSVILALIFLMRLGGTPVWAAPEYRETGQIELPRVFDTFRGHFAFQKDGSIDAFWIEVEGWDGDFENPFKKITPHFYHSPDGGKTWETRSTDWLTEAYNRYGEGSSQFYTILSQGDMQTDGEGNLYFLTGAGEVHYTGNYVGSTIKLILLKLTGEQVTLLHDFGPEQKDFTADAICLGGCTKEGIYLNYQDATDETGLSTGYFVLDRNSGKILERHTFGPKAAVECAFQFDGKVYGRNIMFIFNNELVGRETNRRLLLVYDKATGKEIQKIPGPDDPVKDSTRWYQDSCTYTMDSDGTFYMYHDDYGVYRMRQDETAFTKILTAEQAHFEKGRVCLVYGGYNGTFYVAEFYNEDILKDPKNWSGKKIWIYTPVNG